MTLFPTYLAKTVPLFWTNFKSFQHHLFTDNNQVGRPSANDQFLKFFRFAVVPFVLHPDYNDQNTLPSTGKKAEN